MAVRMPESAMRFDPEYITEEDLADLASFTGMTIDECLGRLRDYSTKEMAEAWRAANPSSPSELLGFYQSTDLYIWELMQWHASAARAPYWHALSSFVETNPPSDDFRSVFDFGCGIGTDALFLAERGYEVTAVDVRGPVLEFARQRLTRRGLQAHFVESVSDIPSLEKTFDAAVCFDVFEHLPDPLIAAQALVEGLRPGGVLLQQGTFDDGGLHPCHLKKGIERFAGLRWHIHLAGLGLKHAGSLSYLKCSGVEYWLQRARYELWRATGLWLVKTDG